jgi:hypothetical protein
VKLGRTWLRASQPDMARVRGRALRLVSRVSQVGLLLASLLLCGPLLAQDGANGPDADGKDAAESRATAFQAVEGPQKEQVPGGALLISAYALVLVLLVAYVGRLGALQSKTAAEVERLARALERGKPE